MFKHIQDFFHLPTNEEMHKDIASKPSTLIPALRILLEDAERQIVLTNYTAAERRIAVARNLIKLSGVK